VTGFEKKDPVIVLTGNWEGHTGAVTALAPDVKKGIGVKVDSRVVGGKTKAGYDLVWYEPEEIKKAV